MRKVLFLMFLLLLMGLGAAGVKAQVRIGGNTAPSKAAVLDLNATDAANTGTGGLVLPRVDLTSNTMQLTVGVANVTGTMVYDVTATLGRTGVYYWNGNNWVLASLPFTSASDSGRVLISDGITWYSGTLTNTKTIDIVPQDYVPFDVPVAWYMVYNAWVVLPESGPGTQYLIKIPNLAPFDFCTNIGDLDASFTLTATSDGLLVAPATASGKQSEGIWLRCYHPSF